MKRPEKCFQCLQIWRRHENALQFRIGACVKNIDQVSTRMSSHHHTIFNIIFLFPAGLSVSRQPSHGDPAQTTRQPGHPLPLQRLLQLYIQVKLELYRITIFINFPFIPLHHNDWIGFDDWTFSKTEPNAS